jgi:hypothetical protein
MAMARSTAPAKVIGIGKGPAARERENARLDAEIARRDALAETRALESEAVISAEVGRLQVAAAAARAEVQHWRQAAQHWQAEAQQLREQLAGRKRRPSTLTLGEAMGSDDGDGQ